MIIGKYIRIGQLGKLCHDCLTILSHNLLGTNRPEGWVRTDQKWVQNV